MARPGCSTRPANPPGRPICTTSHSSDGVTNASAVGDRSARQIVFVADADGSDAIRLNCVLATADEPIWSPDGQWIAYRQVDRSVNGSGAGAVADGATGIVIVHPDGTNERPIAAAGVSDVGWSPDSEHLRFIRSDGRGSAETIWESFLSASRTLSLRHSGRPRISSSERVAGSPGRARRHRDTPPLPGVSHLPRSGDRTRHATAGRVRRPERHVADARDRERRRLPTDDRGDGHRHRRGPGESVR